MRRRQVRPSDYHEPPEGVGSHQHAQGLPDEVHQRINTLALEVAQRVARAYRKDSKRGFAKWGCWPRRGGDGLIHYQHKVKDCVLEIAGVPALLNQAIEIKLAHYLPGTRCVHLPKPRPKAQCSCLWWCYDFDILPFLYGLLSESNNTATLSVLCHQGIFAFMHGNLVRLVFAVHDPVCSE